MLNVPPLPAFPLPASLSASTGEIAFSALGRLEPFGKRRKEFGKAESPQRAERAGASESTWPQAG